MSLPPRKNSTSSKSSKNDLSPLQTLLQMGFSRNRALKALAATGNRSVQLASDWLLTHVNDPFIDVDTPREYIIYACPTGPLLNELLDFWEKSKAVGGWNSAHNFPPHITLVPFFKAPDETALLLTKAMKYVAHKSNIKLPNSPLQLEPYQSQNFMGLFVSGEHADYLKDLTDLYVKELTVSVPLDVTNRLLYITLAYHFEVGAYEALKKLVDEMSTIDTCNWELRLYSRDSRFANHQVHKVIESHTPRENDELELVIGDYIYIDDKDIEESTDGWVQGTSWLTGVTGILPAVYTRRTAESDAWTLHNLVTVQSYNTDKSESDSAMDPVITNSKSELAKDKSDATYDEWKKFWKAMHFEKDPDFMEAVQGDKMQWDLNQSNANAKGDGKLIVEHSNVTKNGCESNASKRRWIFALRHGERVDLTFGDWVQHCFNDKGEYMRKDLNMPVKLGERAGGKDAYYKDTPLTRVGEFQSNLVGEGLREANIQVRHVYASCALRSVQTAHYMLEGMKADPSVKIRVEPGLFECKMWYQSRGMAFMTPIELHKAGFNVDLDYKPYVELDLETQESLEEYYKRNELVMQSAVRETQEDGGNIMFVGHAATLDMMAISLKRFDSTEEEYPPYQVFKNLLRVPYCALAAAKDSPMELVCPPCPPSINSSSGRFDWRLLCDLK